MAEWLKAPVLKTGEAQASGGSNPPLSDCLPHLEMPGDGQPAYFGQPDAQPRTGTMRGPQPPNPTRALHHRLRYSSRKRAVKCRNDGGSHVISRPRNWARCAYSSVNASIT